MPGGSTVTAFFAEDSLDGLEEVPASRPWPVRVASDDDHDATSKSWAPASDFITRPSFGIAGEDLELDLVYSPEDDIYHNTMDASSSPAAAFLSAFTLPPPPPSHSEDAIAGYVLGATIGNGGFSTIKLATAPSGGIVAVKIVRHTAFNTLPPREKARQRSRLSHEARVWVSLSHENILPLFDSHRTPEATYLITLYCPAGSLLDILKREGTPALEQTDAGCMFRQIVKALRYLHEIMEFVHGDVKLENVLVDESGVCRLADFGLTRRIGGDSSQVSSGEDDEDEPRDRSKRSGTSALPVHLSLMRHGPQRHRNSSPLPATVTPPTHPDHSFLPGSLPYAAPELLLPHAQSMEAVNGHSRRPTAHPAQDMWALGVLLYALLTGVLPFRDPFEPRLQMKILRGTYEPPPAIGPLAESVLKGCLERNVGERWTIAMVDDASWGIGYGNVEVDPVLCEEQRAQSQSQARARARGMCLGLGRLLSPARGCDEELLASMSSCSLVSSAGMHAMGSRSPIPRGTARGRRRDRTEDVRSQSRSPSPSVAPRTPEDDDSEAVMYFSTRQRGRGRGNQGDVQIVLEDDEDGDLGASGDVDSREGEEKPEEKREGSRSRRWSLDSLAR